MKIGKCLNIFGLVLIGLTFLFLGSSCQDDDCGGPPSPFCPNGYVPEGCDCTCPTERIEYASPIDGASVCLRSGNIPPDEVYIHDMSDDFPLACDRGIISIDIRYDQVWRESVLRKYPYQGFVSFGSELSGRETGKSWAYFYYKQPDPDTIFLDALIDFFPFNEFWGCRKGGYFEGYAVRSEDALDWHMELYEYGVSHTDIVSRVVDPDHVVEFTTPRVK